MGKATARMIWYNVVAEPPENSFITNFISLVDGRVGLGGKGWYIEADRQANPSVTRTLRQHVLAFEGKGIYLDHDVLRVLGVDPRGLKPALAVGNKRLFKLTAELNELISHSVGYERRSERERYVQQRNAGIWNALLGLAQEWQVEPWQVPQ